MLIIASYPIYNALKLYVFKLKYTTANVVIYADILCFNLQYFFYLLNFVLWFIHFLSYFCSLYGNKKGIVLKYSIQPLILYLLFPIIWEVSSIISLQLFCR